jgi:hypothetical protein
MGINRTFPASSMGAPCFLCRATQQSRRASLERPRHSASYRRARASACFTHASTCASVPRHLRACAPAVPRTSKAAMTARVMGRSAIAPSKQATKAFRWRARGGFRQILRGCCSVAAAAPTNPAPAAILAANDTRCLAEEGRLRTQTRPNPTRVR